MNKALVWVHGCSLQADGWQDSVIGVGKKLGRAPCGLRLSCEFDKVLLVLGSGVIARNGIRESAYTHQKLGEWLGTPAARSVFASRYSFDEAKRIYEQAHIDTVSQNTAEEISTALSLCYTYGCNALWLVSSPAHMPRCLNEALKAKHGGIRIYAAPSETNTHNFAPEYTVIVEYPHRGDDPSPYMGGHVRRMLRVPPSERVTMLQDLDVLLRAYHV